MAEYLPVVVAVGIGGLIYMEETSKPNKKKDEEKESHVMANYREVGVNASATHALIQKSMLMGRPLTGHHGFIERPNKTIEDVFVMNKNLLEFDRYDSMRSFWTQQSEVPPKRQGAIFASLTKDIATGDGSTNMQFDKWIPHWANEAELEAVRRIAQTGRMEEAEIARYGVEVFTRAPGQPFRWESSN